MVGRLRGDLGQQPRLDRWRRRDQLQRVRQERKRLACRDYLTFALGAASGQMGLEGDDLIAVQCPQGVYVCLCQPCLMVHLDPPVSSVPGGGGPGSILVPGFCSGVGFLTGLSTKGGSEDGFRFPAV